MRRRCLRRWHIDEKKFAYLYICFTNVLFLLSLTPKATELTKAFVDVDISNVNVPSYSIQPQSL